MVFCGLGGFGRCLVRLPKAPTPDHQILMVFDGFCGFGFLLVVLVVLAVADKAPWGTLYNHMCMVCDGCCVSGCLVVVLVVLAVAGRAP